MVHEGVECVQSCRITDSDCISLPTVPSIIPEVSAPSFANTAASQTERVYISSGPLFMGGWTGPPDPLEYVGGVRVCWPPKMSHYFIQNCWITKQVSHYQELKTLSKMERKTNFSKRLKQFDGLTWLTVTPRFYHCISWTSMETKFKSAKWGMSGRWIACSTTNTEHKSYHI